MTTIEATFSSGTFLASLSESCSVVPSGQLSLTSPTGPKQPSFPYDSPGPWSKSAPLPSSLKAVTGSSLFPAIPSLSGLSARILPLLAESSPSESWNTLEAVVTRLQKLASNVENDWAQSALASIEDENDIGVYPPTLRLACYMWFTAKHLSARFTRACGEYLDHSQNSPFHDSDALAVYPLYHYLLPSCVIYCSSARARAICCSRADSLLACSINAPHALPPLLRDYQVRRGYTNKR